MSSLHAAVWIDHNEAKIFHIDDETLDAEMIHPRKHLRRHPAQTAERSHPADEQHFFHEVAQALEGIALVVLSAIRRRRVEGSDVS
jgi:hypothetical protein